jgi:hypothetical protein
LNIKVSVSISVDISNIKRLLMDKFVNDLLTEDILNEVSKRYDIKRENLYFVGGFENYIYGFDKDDKYISYLRAA